MTSLCEQQTKMLLFGYIRRTKLNVPDAVTLICHRFYPYFEYVQFSIFNPASSVSEEDHTYLQSLDAVNQTFMASQGYNTGHHQWIIKCVRSVGLNAGIGVSMIAKDASFNFVTQKASWLSDPEFSYSYYWWSGRYRSAIYKYEKGVRPELVQSKQCYLTGDIVIVCLDCNRWKLSFRLISMSTGPEIAICEEFDIMPTEPDQLYFPSLCTSHRGEFKVLLNL